MGGIPAKLEGQTIALFHLEIRRVNEVLGPDVDLEVKHQPIRARRKLKAARRPVYPGHPGSIFETDHQLHGHGDATLDSLHDPDDPRVCSPRRHEINDPHDALG